MYFSCRKDGAIELQITLSQEVHRTSNILHVVQNPGARVRVQNTNKEHHLKPKRVIPHEEESVFHNKPPPIVD